MARQGAAVRLTCGLFRIASAARPSDIGSCCASFQSVVAHAEAIEIAGVLLEATLALPDDA